MDATGARAQEKNGCVCAENILSFVRGDVQKWCDFGWWGITLPKSLAFCDYFAWRLGLECHVNESLLG
jgi:hypothetical protein